jgi:hypothetical protein
MVDGGLAANADRVIEAVLDTFDQDRVHTLVNTHWHPEQTGANERLGWKGLSYFIFPNGLQVGTINAVSIARVQEVLTPRQAHDCWAYGVCLLRAFVQGTSPDDCVPGPGRGTSPMQVLTRYRDEVLASTVEGQYYIDLYAQHSLDMFRASIAEPDFLARVTRAEAAWVAAFEALADGAGGGAIVTQQMQDDLNGVLDTFAARGTPDLVAVVTTERQRLQLNAIAGLTISEFQDQVETLGGPSAVTQHSWGRVKSLYR